MKNIIKVKEDPSFGRDLLTGAIVNLNNEAYESYIRNKKQKENIQNRLDTLENDIQEIKSMFSTLLQRLDNK